MENIKIRNPGIKSTNGYDISEDPPLLVTKVNNSESLFYVSQFDEERFLVAKYSCETFYTCTSTSESYTELPVKEIFGDFFDMEYRKRESVELHFDLETDVNFLKTPEQDGFFLKYFSEIKRVKFKERESGNGDSELNSFHFSDFVILKKKIFFLSGRRLVSINRDVFYKTVLNESWNDEVEICINDVGLKYNSLTICEEGQKGIPKVTFSKERINIAFVEHEFGFHFSNIYSVDINNMDVKKYILPICSNADHNYIIDLYDNGVDEFMKYLRLISYIEKNHEGNYIFFQKGYLRFMRETIISYDPDKVDILISSSNDGCSKMFNNLFSKDDLLITKGVLEMLNSPRTLICDLNLILKRYKKYIPEIFKSEIKKGDVSRTFLDNIIFIYRNFENSLDLAKKMLSGNNPEFYVGMNLLQGEVEEANNDSFIIKVLRNYEAIEDRSVVFKSKNEIPVNQVIEKLTFLVKMDPALLLGARQFLSLDLYDHLPYRIILSAVEAAFFWENEHGVTLINFLMGLGISNLNIQIKNKLKKSVFMEYDNIEKKVVLKSDKQLISDYITIIKNSETKNTENYWREILYSNNEEVRESGLKFLKKIDSEKKFFELLYFEIINNFENLLEGNPGKEVEFILGNYIGNLLCLAKSEKIDDEIYKIKPNYLVILFIRNLCMNNTLDRFRVLEELLGREQYINDINFLKNEFRKSQNIGSLSKKERINTLQIILGNINNSMINPEIIYLCALYVVFSRGYIDISLDLKGIEGLLFYLKLILEKMSKENDFRGILAKIVLLELRIDKKWLPVVRDLTLNDEWEGYHSIKYLAKKVLRNFEKQELRIPDDEVTLQN